MQDPDSVVATPDAEAVAEEPAKVEYLEFLGTDAAFGTDFYTKEVGGVGHTISNAHMKKYHDIELGVKEAAWKRGNNGRFLFPTADLNPAAVEVLAKDGMFKVVTL